MVNSTNVNDSVVDEDFVTTSNTIQEALAARYGEDVDVSRAADLVSSGKVSEQEMAHIVDKIHKKKSSKSNDIRNPMWKAVICCFAGRGKCVSGSHCFYAHSKSDMRTAHVNRLKTAGIDTRTGIPRGKYVYDVMHVLDRSDRNGARNNATLRLVPTNTAEGFRVLCAIPGVNEDYITDRLTGRGNEPWTYSHASQVGRTPHLPMRSYDPVGVPSNTYYGQYVPYRLSQTDNGAMQYDTYGIYMHSEYAQGFAIAPTVAPVYTGYFNPIQSYNPMEMAPSLQSASLTYETNTGDACAVSTIASDSSMCDHGAGSQGSDVAAPSRQHSRSETIDPTHDSSDSSILLAANESQLHHSSSMQRLQEIWDSTLKEFDSFANPSDKSEKCNMDDLPSHSDSFLSALHVAEALVDERSDMSNPLDKILKSDRLGETTNYDSNNIASTNSISKAVNTTVSAVSSVGSLVPMQLCSLNFSATIDSTDEPSAP